MPKDRAAREGVPPDKHATLTGYATLGCRCDVCRAFIGVYSHEARLRRHQDMMDGLAHPPHGTAGTYYNFLCRDECPASPSCRDAASAQRTALNRRKAAERAERAS